MAKGREENPHDEAEDGPAHAMLLGMLLQIADGQDAQHRATGAKTNSTANKPA